MLKKPNQTRKPCTKKQLCSAALEMNRSPCLLACFKQPRDFLRLPRALPTPARDVHNAWTGADIVTFGEQEKAALKFLLKILSIICDSVLTMQMASGCGKGINCDEYPAATTTFLAWFSARGSLWQLCYRFQWVQVSHHPCLPWGRAKAAVSLPDTSFRQCKRALNEHKCKFSLPKSPFIVPHQCKGSFSRNKILALNVVNRSAFPSIQNHKDNKLWLLQKSVHIQRKSPGWWGISKALNAWEQGQSLSARALLKTPPAPDSRIS